MDKKLMIHVLEGHEKDADENISKALKEHRFDGEYYIQTTCKTDVKFYKNVGGYGVFRALNNNVPSVDPDGTIGCFVQLTGPQRRGDTFAVICQHCIEADFDNPHVSFCTSRDLSNQSPEFAREFSRDIEYHMLDKEVPVDIALLPLNESFAALNVEENQCGLYEGDISELEHMKVQKQGAATGLTTGVISCADYTGIVAGKWYDHMMVVESDVPGKKFSEGGDSGSLVTLKNKREAVAIVFACGHVKFRYGEKVSFAFHLEEAINLLLVENKIDDDYIILSSFT